MRHAHRPAFFCCKEGRSQRYIPYVPAAQPETRRQVIEIDLFVQWQLLWPDRFPDAPPAIFLWEWESNRERKSSQERFIHVLAQVRGQNHRTLVDFHLLQKIADF